MQYDEFINHVQQRANLGSRQDAETVTTIVLSTLTEPLRREATNSLASQLPKELKNLVAGNRADPILTMQQYSLEEFYNRLKARLGVTHKEAVRVAQVVTDVLSQAVTPGLIAEVKQDLPDEYGRLFNGQG